MLVPQPYCASGIKMRFENVGRRKVMTGFDVSSTRLVEIRTKNEWFGQWS